MKSKTGPRIGSARRNQPRLAGGRFHRQGNSLTRLVSDNCERDLPPAHQNRKHVPRGLTWAPSYRPCRRLSNALLSALCPWRWRPLFPQWVEWHFEGRGGWGISGQASVTLSPRPPSTLHPSWPTGPWQFHTTLFCKRPRRGQQGA